MSVINRSSLRSVLWSFVPAVALLALTSCADVSLPPREAPPTVKSVNAGEEEFATPEAGVTALVAASRTDNKAELLKILGPKAGKILHSGDKVADKAGRKKFLAAYDTKHSIESQKDGRKVVLVGAEDWPMPIPLMQSQCGWWFDTAAGEDEILNRRIGRNELNVMQVLRVYLEAQQEYADQHPVKNGGHEYAKRVLSHKGTHDGLYWPVASNQKESPFGPLMAQATAEGYIAKTAKPDGSKTDGGKPHRSPYHGYYYKILRQQGPNAAGGAMDYVVHGHMTGGFAVIAWPARYGNSGVMTFMIDRNGIIYENNLGHDTTARVSRIKSFDPDPSWHIVQ